MILLWIENLLNKYCKDDVIINRWHVNMVEHKVSVIGKDLIVVSYASTRD